MASLQNRLIVGLITLVLAAGLAAGVFSFRWAFDEAIELQDAILRQVGMLAARNRLSVDPSGENEIDAEARVAIEELDPASRPADRAPPAVPQLPANLPDGLQTTSRRGESWRVLVRTRVDGSRVAVSQPTASRDEIARDSALRTLLPLAGLIPCLALFVGIIVHFSFRPVSQLAARLDVRQADDPEPLPSTGMPKELIPFIASINRLLERIGTLLDRQRRFIADAAHELRTPIAALSVQAENLDHVALSPDSTERLASLKAGIHRTGHLLEQLLALARYEAGDTTRNPVTDLAGVAKEVVAEWLPLARQRLIDLGFGCIESGATVRADATALRVMVRNLVDNALRHTPANGRVDVDIFRRDANVVLRIEDTGPGIPEPELERVFEPFNRGGQPKGEGSGLGLSIVRSIVDGHGGLSMIENLTWDGRSGLRVTVVLPATHECD